MLGNLPLQLRLNLGALLEQLVKPQHAFPVRGRGRRAARTVATASRPHATLAGRFKQWTHHCWLASVRVGLTLHLKSRNPRLHFQLFAENRRTSSTLACARRWTPPNGRRAALRVSQG